MILEPSLLWSCVADTKSIDRVLRSKSSALRLSNPAASCLWSGENKTRKDWTTVTVRYYSESFFLFSVLSSSRPKKNRWPLVAFLSPCSCTHQALNSSFNHSLCLLLLLLQQPAPSDCRYQSPWGRKNKHKNKQTSDTRCNGFGRLLCTTLHYPQHSRSYKYIYMCVCVCVCV